jgi:solute carrier family 25 phosphate transporter 23/24/25/41
MANMHGLPVGAVADLWQSFFENYPGENLSPLARLTCGGIAGITSVTFTYPLDIVRTRLSIQSASFAELGSKPKELPGMWATMITMYKTEGGIFALYRGIVPTIAGVAPYVCVRKDADAGYD